MTYWGTPRGPPGTSDPSDEPIPMSPWVLVNVVPVVVSAKLLYFWIDRSSVQRPVFAIWPSVKKPFVCLGHLPVLRTDNLKTAAGLTWRTWRYKTNSILCWALCQQSRKFPRLGPSCWRWLSAEGKVPRLEPTCWRCCLQRGSSLDWGPAAGGGCQSRKFPRLEPVKL